MHAVFALQVTVDIVALDLYRHRLDTGLIALENIGDGGLVVVLFAPAQVHAHEHRSPVLRLGTTGTRVDFQYHAQLVLFATQHVAQLEILNQRHRMVINLVDLLFRNDTLFYKVEGQLQLLDRFLDFGIAVYPEVQRFYLFHLRFGLLLVFPEVGHMGAQLLFFYLDFLRIDVKDTSSTPTCVLLSLLIVLV